LCHQATDLKKITAILLSGMLMFNWFGYQLLTHYLQSKAEARAVAKLDQNDYDESQLIEIRVPINLPYHNDWKEFERYDGQIEIDGIHYNYVKRKVENGELVLLCIPDQEKKLFQTARDNFFSLVNDLQNNSTNKQSDSGNSIAFKNFTSEYRQENNDWSINWVLNDKQSFAMENTALIADPFTSTAEQPPEA
jgi:hypothetical protein